ncbi:hypothetical protein BV25DRAFT_1139259 [Artomyces pyxidatus]|uniref:Uncharacterized protein n=1 Tax=Artomyces pyxidatus TaxID=48021 RepID=A0ACB8STR1_9AGAM|nr:hypothetical protein BV25DRAFT_1139259 [Artomyces pyxidatus]
MLSLRLFRLSAIASSGGTLPERPHHISPHHESRSEGHKPCPRPDLTNAAPPARPPSARRGSMTRLETPSTILVSPLFAQDQPRGASLIAVIL